MDLKNKEIFKFFIGDPEKVREERGLKKVKCNNIDTIKGEFFQECHSKGKN